MSRIPPKWKVEKTKVKVVFRLQFHATNIPQSGWDKLFLSFIPLDTGKATAKTNKTNVRNGNCKWSDPIYETTRLLQDPRTKNYDEKLYRLVVAMGSSRSSLLGDVTINLAEFADASTPSSVALPLNSCGFGTILHVTVQLLTSKTGFREFEQQRELSVKGYQRLAGKGGQESTETAAAASAMCSEQTDKVNAKVRFKEEYRVLHSLEKVAKSSEDYDGVDGSSNTSESLYAEKTDFSSANEIDSPRVMISGDVGVSPIAQSPRMDRHLSTQGSIEWAHGWSSDYSADNDLATAYEENNRLKGRLEAVESAFSQLKTEANSLQGLTNDLGSETQIFAKQLVAEIASGEKLSTEVSLLKSEYSKFKNDLEELKSSTALSTDCGKISPELQTKWLQDLSLIEGKVEDIHNKTRLAYYGNDTDFLQSDFKLLDSHLQNLKHGIAAGTSLEPVQGHQSNVPQLELFNRGPWLERSYMDHNLDNKKNVDPPIIEEQKMFELLQKLEEAKTENVNLAKKMDQMECYYETFIQELEENRQQTVNELERLRTEHSSCHYTVSALHSQVEKLRLDMNEQFVRFEADRQDLDSLNKELEKKAMASEAVLKRVRWNYAIAVDRLQKDLELLSFQVLSMYETNENFAKQALADVSQLFCSQHPDEVSEEQDMSAVNVGSENADHKKLQNFEFIDRNGSVLQRGLLHNSLSSTTEKTHSQARHGESDKGHPEDMLSSQILKELQSNAQPELSEIHMLDVHWEVFTKVLQEILRDTSHEVKHVKEKNAQLIQKLEDSRAEIEALQRNWRSSLEEAGTLREDKAKMHTEYDDLAIKSKILGANLQDVTDQNTSLSKKLAECIMECGDYESKYRSCLVEKDHFEEMLKGESHQRSSLQTEITSTVEEFKALKKEFDKQSLANSDMQKVICNLEEKLRLLCSSTASRNEDIHGSTVDVMSLEEKLGSNDLMAILSHLEYFHDEAYKKILQIRQEKQELEKQNDVAKCSLNEMKSRILHMEKKYESEGEEITRKLDLTNNLVGQLKMELEDVTKKLKSSLEAEERSTLKSRELASKLTIVEIEIKQVSDENRDLAQKLLSCNNVSEELENTKLTLTDCLKENSDLKVSLESEKAASIQTENESSRLKESLKCAHDEMERERRLRKELEARVEDLALQLAEKVKQILSLEEELAQMLLAYNNASEELDKTKSTLEDCMNENRDLKVSLESEKVASIQKEVDFSQLKESLKCANDEIEHDGRLRNELEARVEDLTLQLAEKFQHLLFHEEQKDELVLLRKRVLDLETEVHHLLSSADERQQGQKNETSSLHFQVSELENELVGTLHRSLDTDVKITYLRNQLQSMVQGLVYQNKALQGDIKDLNLKHLHSVASLGDEVSQLKESLRCAHVQMQIDGRVTKELKATVQDLTLQLTDNTQQLLLSDEQKTELVLLRKKVLDLETELHCVLSISKESQSKQDDDISFLRLQVSDLKNETLENSVTTEVKAVFFRSQFQLIIEYLVNQNNSLQGDLEELNQKHINIVNSLEAHMASEAQLLAENVKLSAALQSLTAECELVSHEKEALVAQIEENNATLLDIEDMKDRNAAVQAHYSQENLKFEDEIRCLKKTLVSLEEEVDSLRSSRDELETTVVILTSKLEEQKHHMSLFEDCNNDLKKLREQYNELTFKLSEQVLKTEEFKNLSIHLRELKDKADAENVQARQKKEADGSSLAMQESLRMAFIKEQCESKLQEMKSQLCASNRYAEEMLLKLQNSLDEVESGKKTESILLKRNEEFSMKISEMESELHANMTERRELEKAFERMKAELECTRLSLDCCREEKLKLEASLHECSEEKTRTHVELDLVKRLLENMASSASDNEGQKNYELHRQGTTSIGELLEDGSNARVLRSGNGAMASNHNVEDTEQEPLLETEAEKIDDISQHFKDRNKILTSMDLLHKELERLKNDNLSSALPLEDHLDPALQHLESELSQLDTANEQLGSISPLFKELPGSGSALQRVLAMELELAGALQVKRSSDMRLKSSFLKQHDDEEAVFRSFKDINELIKDMLMLKKRYASVETELTEMQDRYSQLSLKFAEVEGERQQLAMTLKNRTPKKSDSPRSRAV